MARAFVSLDRALDVYMVGGPFTSSMPKPQRTPAIALRKLESHALVGRIGHHPRFADNRIRAGREKRQGEL